MRRLMVVFEAGIVVFVLGAGLICVYYWFLLLVALLPAAAATGGDAGGAAGRQRLAVVIPAHNEEAVLAATLRSCLGLEYPRDLFEIFVVADNCTDRTATVARGYGVTVLERHDEVNRGKGFALAHAFEQVLARDFAAVVIVDADCAIDAHALRVVAARLAEGRKALQLNNTVSNPDQSAMSYVLAVGNFVENQLFYAPKSRLGLAVFLRGTGMVIHSDLLRAYPWHAHSIVEDVEYSLTLIRAGQRIVFVPEAKVASPSPVDLEQLRIQRTRWAKGNFAFGRKAALALIREGITTARGRLVDAGWTLLVLSRPLVLLLLLSAMAGAVGWQLVAGEGSRQGYLPAALLLGTGMLAYGGVGVVLMGLSWKRLGYLLRMPLMVSRLIVTSVRGLAGSAGDPWLRTPR